LILNETNVENDYLNVGTPKLLAHLHTLLEHTVEALAANSHDVNVDFAAAKGLGSLITLEARLGDGENSVHAEGDTDAGNLGLGKEHAHQVIITTTSGDTTNTQSGVIGPVIIFRSLLLRGLLRLLGLGRISLHSGGRALGDNLIDHTSIIIQATCQRHVERDLIEAVKGLKVIHQQSHIGQTGLGRLICNKSLVLQQTVQ
jgi:hypothetical protein